MKERLTGAIILVAVIVLLVPELLSGPKPGRAPGAAAGAAEEPPLRSYTINLAEDARQRTGGTPSGPAMPQPSGVEQGSHSGPTTASAEQQSDASAAAADPNELAGSQPAPGESSTATTTAPLPQASAQSPASHSTGSRASASTVKSKPVTKAASPAKVSTAAAGPGGWMVQLGVFASRTNAERLALDVRVKGLRASVSEVTTSGRRFYRVRVGPAADRAGAQELQTRLRAAGRPSGTIVPAS